jgi:hypothetical protein
MFSSKCPISQTHIAGGEVNQFLRASRNALFSRIEWDCYRYKDHSILFVVNYQGSIVVLIIKCIRAERKQLIVFHYFKRLHLLFSELAL